MYEEYVLQTFIPREKKMEESEMIDVIGDMMRLERDRKI